MRTRFQRLNAVKLRKTDVLKLEGSKEPATLSGECGGVYPASGQVDHKLDAQNGAPVSDANPTHGRGAAAPLSTQARDFHVKEWEFLRTDIRIQIEHSRNLEFATIIALATFYAWFFTATKPVPQFFLGLPSFLVFLAALRSLSTLRQIQRTARYLRILEEGLSANEGNLIGWDRTRDLHPTRIPGLKVSAALLWLAAFAVSVAAWWWL